MLGDNETFSPRLELLRLLYIQGGLSVNGIQNSFLQFGLGVVSAFSLLRCTNIDVGTYNTPRAGYSNVSAKDATEVALY